MASPTQPTTSKFHRLVEILGISAFMMASAVVVGDLITTSFGYIQTQTEALHVVVILLGAGLAGLLAADLISGLVHWAADNWGRESWPILGKNFIQPFRHHHEDQSQITRHDFVDLNGNNCIVSLPCFWASALVQTDFDGASLFWGSFWFSLAWWVFATNQFHAWAHVAHPPKFVRFLQKFGIILNKRHHAEHHHPPHRRNYCITTGWMNRPLEFLGFFTHADKLMKRLFR